VPWLHLVVKNIGNPGIILLLPNNKTMLNEMPSSRQITVTTNVNSNTSSILTGVDVPLYDMEILKGWKAKWIDIKAGLHILRLAIKNYRSIAKSVRVIKKLYQFKKAILGGMQTKLVRVNNKYYHTLYAPGYPSKAFDNYIEGEFHRILPIKKKANLLSFIFLAITKKCPLQCEHCFEWNNLNKSESFQLEDLRAVVSKFQKDGIAQFHLSGGEPMVRIKDLVQVVTSGSVESEFYVLTSGFNFTKENAASLKRAGLTGVVISLDHFDPDLHNTFRGVSNSFDDVMNAVRNAQEQSLLITLSICVTRSFATWENLLQYAALAKNLNVSFIQLLEPKAVGHYQGKAVLLDESHLRLLDKFYCSLNFDKIYNEYPVIVYHGYHQRRMGCLAGGNRTLYIDSEGYVNACPFCQTKNFNIKDAIKADLNVAASLKISGCQLYENA
jgi:MoaA/NifB/PqqE/SkfB family radical SAM enzyme